VEVPGSSIATSLVLCSCDPHAVDGSDIVFALSALGTPLCRPNDFDCAWAKAAISALNRIDASA
jgi:hypothetical protein